MTQPRRRRVVTTVSLDADQVKALDRLAEQRRGERSQLIRQAIDLLLRLEEGAADD